MTILNTLFDWVLSAGLRASLLVPVVLGAQWLLRKHLPANWRYALWLPVLVVLLVPALPILPSSVTQRVSPQEAPAAAVTKQVASPLPSVGTSAPGAEAAPLVTRESPSAGFPLPAERVGTERAPTSPVSTVGIETPTETRPDAITSIDWRTLALGVWVLGATTVGLAILASFVLMMRRVRRTALPLHPELVARVAQLAPAAGLRDVPRVWKSSAIASPAVCGFWRPVLLLNERFDEDFSKDEMDMIPRFQHLNDFSEGLAGVPLGDEGWGFIDRTGKTVIPPRFGWVLGSFRHGIVEVVLDGKAGYINTKGEWVWSPSE
jgi:beta-lactamase regulating signal transducer with metallopeptidase domain